MDSSQYHLGRLFLTKRTVSTMPLCLPAPNISFLQVIIPLAMEKKLSKLIIYNTICHICWLPNIHQLGSAALTNNFVSKYRRYHFYCSKWICRIFHVTSVPSPYKCISLSYCSVFFTLPITCSSTKLLYNI